MNQKEIVFDGFSRKKARRRRKGKKTDRSVNAQFSQSTSRLCNNKTCTVIVGTDSVGEKFCAISDFNQRILDLRKEKRERLIKEGAFINSMSRFKSSARNTSEGLGDCTDYVDILDTYYDTQASILDSYFFE